MVGSIKRCHVLTNKYFIGNEIIETFQQVILYCIPHFITIRIKHTCLGMYS